MKFELKNTIDKLYLTYHGNVIEEKITHSNQQLIISTEHGNLIEDVTNSLKFIEMNVDYTKICFLDGMEILIPNKQK